MEIIKNYIGGEWVESASARSLPNFCPGTGEKYSELPDSDEKDIERAIQAAKLAFPAWSALSTQARAKILRKIASLIEGNLERLAQAEAIDTGKPISLARKLDIPRSAQNFEFFADAITQFSSEFHGDDPHHLNYTLRKPLGVIACISPWNLPLYLLSWKIAPALAAGNTVVAKPSEITPMTAHLLTRLCADAGLPPGVLNIVHGLGPKLGPRLISHPEIKAISFTGSTRTGAEISKIASPLFKKLSLEMGGKNPTVVFADADLESAVATTVRSAFLNQGQICLCGSRILVEKSIYPKFKAELTKAILLLKQGDPLSPETDQGALVSKAHYEKVLGYLKLAKAEGGAFLTGGIPEAEKSGWFIRPTLIEGLSVNSAINQEEIFGPVATITPFETESEALNFANGTRYGLAANIWTRDLDRAHRFAALLEFGIVWVNCWMNRDLRTPFGGVKDSGVGREGGFDALRFFSETKNICVQVRT